MNRACPSRSWKPDLRAALEPASQQQDPITQKADPLSCQRSTGTAFAKAPIVPVIAAPLFQEGLTPTTRPPKRVVDCDEHNVARFRPMVNAIPLLSPSWHAKGSIGSQCWRCVNDVLQNSVEMRPDDSKNRNGAAPCAAPFRFDPQSASGDSLGLARNGLHCFGFATGTPMPRQGHLKVLTGGDHGFQPAAVFFHGQVPSFPESL